MEYVDVLRMVDRLIITTFGGISIVLGYYLFKCGILNISDAEWDGLGIKLKLTKASPGIFFCLFGMIILITSLQEKVSLSISNNIEPDIASSEQVGISMERKFLGVLNDTNWDVAITSLNSTVTLFEEYALDSEVKKLKEVRANVLYGAFGEDDYNFYIKYLSSDMIELDGRARARWFTLNRRAMNQATKKESVQ